MSLERDEFRQIVFYCDGHKCNETLVTDDTDFRGALETLDRANWIARRNGPDGSWAHYCQDCHKIEFKPVE